MLLKSCRSSVVVARAVARPLAKSSLRCLSHLSSPGASPMLIPSASAVVRKAPTIVRACSNHAPSQSGLEKSLREFRKDDELLVCTQCGTQHGAKAGGLTDCHICDDPRESVPATGHAFTTLGEAKASGKFKNIIRQQYENEPHIYTIQTQSVLGIGQRCFLIKTPKGNILWDCVAYIDDATVEQIQALGGIDAISISHPHFFTSHLTWSRAFNNAPVYLSAEEGHLVSRPDEHGVRRFVTEREFEILPGSGATRIKTGGHFPGSSVLHYKNSMFTSDSLHVTRSALWDINRKPGTAYYAFLWSHVNTIPLTPGAVAGIISAIKPYDFDVAHGMFPDRDLKRHAKERAIDSARVVINAMGHNADQYLPLV